MELTKMEKHLLTGLKFFPLTREHMAMVLVMMDTEEKQEQMIEYLRRNGIAQEKDILEEAHRIARMGI